MARKSAPETQRPANLTVQQMKAAIPKLQRRITELEAIDVNTIQDRGEPRFDALRQKCDDTLMDVFGPDTIEYKKFRIHGFDTASINYLYPTPLHEIREGFKDGIGYAVSNLRTIIELFQEKLADLGETTDGRAKQAFGNLDLHPEIERAAGTLFNDGHYSNAVEDACKVLDALVKLRSGKSDMSGTELMQAVFSAKSPILRFNDLQTESDRSEQQGMMFLYAGAMLALRNPRAHELIHDDPELALEYIGFLSLLAKSLDRAKR